MVTALVSQSLFDDRDDNFNRGSGQSEAGCKGQGDESATASGWKDARRAPDDYRSRRRKEARQDSPREAPLLSCSPAQAARPDS